MHDWHCLRCVPSPLDHPVLVVQRQPRLGWLSRWCWRAALWSLLSISQLFCLVPRHSDGTLGSVRPLPSAWRRLVRWNGCESWRRHDRWLGSQLWRWQWSVHVFVNYANGLLINAVVTMHCQEHVLLLDPRQRRNFWMSVIAMPPSFLPRHSRLMHGQAVELVDLSSLPPSKPKQLRDYTGIHAATTIKQRRRRQMRQG